MMAFVKRIVLVALCLLAFAKAQYGAMHMPDGLSPRYYLAGSPLDRRQSDGSCGSSGYHSCLDVNSTSCCPDTHFCFINATFGGSCCPIGSNCGYTACDAAHYQCAQTTTSNGVATQVAVCCPRSCPGTSAYKCPSAYGGNCCSFGSVCSSNGQCVSTVASSTKGLVSEIPAGCTATTQIACPSSLGGGCCANTESCVVSNNTNYCSAVSVMATRTGSNGIVATLSPKTQGTSSGLSTGAKAGIGAGIAGVVCLVTGALLWFCLAQRRKARQIEEREQEQTSLPVMSQASESERPFPFRQASDYFGPAATAGPFTEDNTSPANRPRNPSGVPLSPHTPSDVAVPVEIDSSISNSNVTSPGNFTPRKSHGMAGSPAELP